jgi:hypothetical protein
MTTEEREKADKECEKFHKDDNYTKRRETAETQFKALRKIVVNLSAAAKWYQQTVEAEEKVRADQVAQLAQLGSGQREEWVEFLESYPSSVGTQPLDDVDIYLRSFLDGEARKVIEGLYFTVGNYAIAIKILTEYYGDEDTYIRLLYGNLHQNYGMA